MKEWNEALESYCREEREVVVKEYMANPLSPCGNTACNIFEKEVKQFQRCAQCKRISHCSRKCQKDEWKRYKKG
jgi:hypothetical protein